LQVLIKWQRLSSIDLIIALLLLEYTFVIITWELGPNAFRETISSYLDMKIGNALKTLLSAVFRNAFKYGIIADMVEVLEEEE
jgi:hypothetical protein